MAQADEFDRQAPTPVGRVSLDVEAIFAWRVAGQIENIALCYRRVVADCEPILAKEPSSDNS